MTENSQQHRACRFGWLPLLGLCLALSLCLSSHRVQAQPTASNSLSGLNTLSRDLVGRAASMRADASRFRIDSTLYREGLRQLLLAAQEQPSAPPPALVTAMIRMSALLHAAAECKTGRYIVCPADLMANLERQQSDLERLLAAADAN